MADEAANLEALFGSDDDDDEYDPAAGAGEAELDEDDLRAQQILASKQAKQPAAKRKRLQKGKESQRKRPSRSTEPSSSTGEGGEGGETIVYEDAYVDADKDSLDGSEAMEDNTPEPGEDGGVLVKKGRRSNAPNVPREVMNNEIRAMQERMDQARQEDAEALSASQPAVFKVGMLAEVMAMMRKRHYHEALIDCGILTSLAEWLKPMDDGSLVNLQVRKGVLESLLLLPVDETTLGSLRTSHIGKYVKLLSLHCKERPENKRTATALVEKWTRPIFRSSVITQASELPTAPVGPGLAALARDNSRSLDDAANEQQTAARSTHARVPRPLGMDFSLLPASTVAPLPSTKHAKDSIKGKLTDKIGTSKRKAVTQAATLSIEGRGIDKM